MVAEDSAWRVMLIPAVGLKRTAQTFATLLDALSDETGRCAILIRPACPSNPASASSTARAQATNGGEGSSVLWMEAAGNRGGSSDVTVATVGSSALTAGSTP